MTNRRTHKRVKKHKPSARFCGAYRVEFYETTAQMWHHWPENMPFPIVLGALTDMPEITSYTEQEDGTHQLH